MLPSAWFNFALAPGGHVQGHRVITRLLLGEGAAMVAPGGDIFDVDIFVKGSGLKWRSGHPWDLSRKRWLCGRG